MEKNPRPDVTVMYVALKYDYGDPRRGLSFEHVTFFDTLTHMRGIRVIPFFFDEVLRAVGREEMNRRLLGEVLRVRPDVCFFALFTDEIRKDVLQEITAHGGAKTVNWFADDHWRFESFSQFWAPLFHWVATTDESSVAAYRQLGCSNVVHVQWACNHFLYRPHPVQQDLEVSFVGQVHSGRRNTIKHLRNAGIDVQCWGRGWENGRLDQHSMVEVFSRSTINLNFTAPSAQWALKPLAKLVMKRRADGTIHLNSIPEVIAGARVLMEPKRTQIKGRNFEIPGSGGFLLTAHAEHLDRYYRPGKEIGVFKDEEDLIRKINYYLEHDEEREAIRRAGYERTLRDHTFELRFQQLFRAMGI